MNSKVNATMDLKSKLLDRCAEDIESILGCYDRLIITGMLVDVGHPDAMTAQLRHRNIRGFDLGVLRPVYEEISRQAIFTVKAPDIARCLNKRLSPEAEAASDFHTRVKGRVTRWLPLFRRVAEKVHSFPLALEVP